jgi:hypothetical protein
MAKDINIHLKVKDSEEARRLLDGFSQDVQKIGGSVEQMGSKTSAASNFLGSFASRLTGLFTLTGIVAAGVKVAQFFDTIKTRSDEAVRNLENVRKGFEGLFEAMGAVDEKSRQGIMSKSAGLMKETGTTAGVEIPIETAYAKAYKGQVESGQISQQQYDTGLKGMLNWGALHPGTAATELIKMMPGWGMNTPEQQGGFSRMVSAAAEKSGLQEADIVEALSRSQSSAMMMGWTPKETLNAIAVIASGESGRQKTTMPAQAIEALGAPQIPDAAKLGELFGIKSERQQKMFGKKLAAQTPQDLNESVRQVTANMAPLDRTKFLTAFYGGSAKAVSKYWTAGPDYAGLEQAAGPAGAATSQEQQFKRMETDEAKNAQKDAEILLIKSRKTRTQKEMERIREIGDEAHKEFQITEPGIQTPRDILLGMEGEKEDAAMRKWIYSLSPEKRAEIIKNYKGNLATAKVPLMDMFAPVEFQKLEDTYNRMSTEEKFKGLMQRSSNVTIQYNNVINYSIGRESEAIPRSGPTDLH